MTVHPVVLVGLRRFPLIGHARPLCPTLDLRLCEISDAVTAAADKGDDGMHDAAHALNKSALIASDAGMAELAQELCWQHIRTYQGLDRPLTFLECRYLLEPVHNLARLQIRAAQGTPAIRLLEAMHQAVTDHHDLIVEEKVLPVGDLVGEPGTEKSLRYWVWRQLLGDGVRALALAGRWADAVRHARTYNGIGDHLFEGRQAAILAHLAQGEAVQAAAVLDRATPTQVWETEVAACLRAMCATAIGDETAAFRHLEAARELLGARDQGPHYASYRARLGLAVATLASGPHPDLAAETAVQAADTAITSADGYAARDVLGCKETLDNVTSHQRAALHRITTSSGLGRGSVTHHDVQRLTKISAEAAALLSSTLRCAKKNDQ